MAPELRVNVKTADLSLRTDLHPRMQDKTLEDEVEQYKAKGSLFKFVASNREFKVS